MYYRSFFAVPESVVAPDGTPSGAVRGFLDMAAYFIREYPAKEIVFAWDTDWRPQWRVDLVPTYKTHRLDEASIAEGYEEIPDNLSPQISAIAGILDAIGLFRLGQVEHEADDILGALISRVKRDAIVVTGDRDLYQLVSDKNQIRVISLNKGMKNLETVTDEYLLNKFGVTGSQYSLFAAMRGDASDGLPGVKGIGEKTAAFLIQEFKTDIGILKAAKQGDKRIKPAAISNLIAAEDYLGAALKVVNVRTDATLPKSLSRPKSILNPGELEFLAKDWGVTKQVDRLLGALNLT